MTSATPSSTSLTTGTATASASPQCSGGPGQRVTHLPDITVPAVTVPEVRSPAVEIDGHRIPPEVLPEITIPAQAVDAGCIIEHDAPGGCIGSVEISGVTIPALTIPGIVISEVKAADGRTLAGRTLEPLTLPAVTVPPVRATQVCQVATQDGVPTVTRPGVVRQAATRPGGARPGFTRPALCGRGGCVPELRVDAVRVPPVRIPDVDVDPSRLRGRDLSAEVAVLEGPDATAYIAGGDVLFETDRARLRPEAVRVLRQVAQRVDNSAGLLVVEGHTDSRGTAAHNLDLSLRRAEAVAAWFRSEGADLSTRVTVRGLGEAAPSHSNATEKGRQRNRRVVITVIS